MSDCFFISALNKSPVDKWHKQYSSLNFGAYVPFPDPGGPNKTNLLSGNF